MNVISKQIENLQEKIIAETKRQISEFGYSATTLRSVARECGIAVGTVYNYFPSKEKMVASAVLEDWKESMSRMKQGTGEIASAEEKLRAIYDELTAFIKAHDRLFRDADAFSTYAAAVTASHIELRRQIADLIRAGLKKETENEFETLFLAESVLTWAKSDTPFDTLWTVLRKIV